MDRHWMEGAKARQVWQTPRLANQHAPRRSMMSTVNVLSHCALQHVEINMLS
jgi:hypothetical protein